MSLISSRCPPVNFNPKSENPHPRRQGQRFTPKQTIPLSVLRNSTCGLLSVLSKGKNVLVHIAKAYGGDGKAPLILSLATRRCVQNHPPDSFILEETYGAQWTRGWVGHRASLDITDKTHLLSPSRGTIPSVLKWVTLVNQLLPDITWNDKLGTRKYHSSSTS
jgi:hypothetical protein